MMMEGSQERRETERAGNALLRSKEGYERGIKEMQWE